MNWSKLEAYKYIGDTSIIDIEKLTPKEFKQFMLEELAKPLDFSQRYLVDDPLTGDYIFWYWAQIRFVPKQIVERLFKRGKLKYFNDQGKGFKDSIVSEDFTGKISTPIYRTNHTDSIEKSFEKYKPKVKPIKEKQDAKKTRSWLTTKKKKKVKKKKPRRRKL